MSQNYYVIKELKQKEGSNNTYGNAIKLGAEQRFVSAMLNSNNNNLEEQNILGTDCVVTEWEDNIGEYEVRKYYDGTGSDVGYYIVFSKKYKSPIDESGIGFEEDSLKISDNTNVAFEDEDSIKFFDGDIFSFDDTDHSLKINIDYSISKEEQLYFRTNTENKSDEKDITDSFISKKIVSTQMKDNKRYRKEIIVKTL